MLSSPKFLKIQHEQHSARSNTHFDKTRQSWQPHRKKPVETTPGKTKEGSHFLLEAAILGLFKHKHSLLHLANTNLVGTSIVGRPTKRVTKSHA